MLKSISGRITLLSILFVIVSISICVGISTNEQKSTMQQLVEEEISISADKSAQTIDEWITDQGNILHTITKTIGYMDTLDTEYVMDYLEICLSENPDALMYYFCLGYDGGIFPADHSKLDLDPTTRSWWIDAVAAGSLVYTAPYKDFATGQMIVSIAEPLKINGEQACLLADITLDTMLEVVGVDEDENYLSSFLLDADGNVIVHANEAYLPSESGSTVLSEKLGQNLSNLNGELITDWDGQQRYVATSTIPTTGWTIGVAKPYNVIESELQESLFLVRIIAVIMIILCILLVGGSVQYHLKPLKAVNNMLEAIAKGDLSQTIKKTKHKDEVSTLQNCAADLQQTLSNIIGESNQVLTEMSRCNLTVADMNQYPGTFNELSSSINTIKHMLVKILKNIQSVASSVDTGSKELQSAADALASGTVTQANSVQTIVTDVDDIANRVRKGVEHELQIVEDMNTLSNRIQSGNADMKELLTVVSDVESMSADIQKIVSTIDSIAFQTNILALNAAIEAARAGESGRGFAVVADEVGALASKSSEASKQTANLIDRCIQQIHTAMQYAENTSESLAAIVDDANGISIAFSYMATETSDQEQKTLSIQEEINTVSDVVQMNTATAEETAASTSALAKEAANLSEMIKRFKV